MPDTMDTRPLWRIGTRTIAAELTRRKDGEAVQRAFLSECDLKLIIAELVRRGYPDTLLYDAQAQRWVGPLGKRWPPDGGDDE